MREMKDSGIEWIEKIPCNWNTNRMKYLFSFGKGLSITKENLIEEGLPVVSYGQIHSKKNNGVAIQEELLRYVSDNYRILFPLSQVYQYDFVFADTSEDYDGCGNFAYKRDDSLLFGGYHVVIAHSMIKTDKRYFAYLFRTDCWRKQIREKVSGVKVFSITQKTISNASVIVPPFEEQISIANYLDSKCGEIDALSADIQTEIDTLEEYKKSVITEAVTKGLNPDVEMKNCGVEWIGNVPNKWAVSKLGNVLSLRNERNYKPLEEVNLISLYTDMGVVQHSDLEKTTGNKAQNADGYKIVHKDDIVVNIILAWMGAMGISNYDGVTSPAYDVYKINTQRIVPHFCHYVLRTPAMAGECYKYGRGIMLMRWRTYSDEFKKIKIPLPPIEEQEEIACFLDSRCAEIDSIIYEKKEQLATLDEYKKSIIYEYVTGKKEVS